MTDQDRLVAGKQLASELVLLAVQLTHAAGELRRGRLDRTERENLADRLVDTALEVRRCDDGPGEPTRTWPG